MKLRVTPFYANYGFHPTFSVTPWWKSIPPLPAITDFSSYLKTICSELQAELKIAQQTAKRKYDKHCAPALSFKPGDLVMLSWHNIKTTSPSNKLDYWKLGPFKIIESIGTNAYHLSLPPSFHHLHLVFNINLLEPYTPPSTFPFHVEGASTPSNILLEGENTLNIREFLDVQKVGHCYDYLVDFMDKDLLEHAWVLLSDISTTHNEFLETFHCRHKSLPRPSDQAFKAKCHVVEIPIPISTPIKSIFESLSITTINPSETHPDLFESVHNAPCLHL